MLTRILPPTKQPPSSPCPHRLLFFSSFMAGAFTVGTLQNALGSVIGGVAGNSGGNYFEKHTSAGLSNSAADYRTKGVSLYEAYASKMSAAEVVAIRRDLAKCVQHHWSRFPALVLTRRACTCAEGRLRWRDVTILTRMEVASHGHGPVGAHLARQRITTGLRLGWSG